MKEKTLLVLLILLHHKVFFNIQYSVGFFVVGSLVGTNAKTQHDMTFDPFDPRFCVGCSYS